MFYGADTEALRSHADAVKRAGGQLQGLGPSLVQVIASVEWVGGDAESFREQGRQVLEQQLAALTDRLTADGNELQAHAAEQDEASGAGEGPGADPGDDNPFWPWQDGWSAPWSDKADIRDDIPLDEEQFGIEAMGQEGFPNCVTVSSLGTMAESDPQFFADRIRQIDDEHYEVELFIDGEWKTVTVEDEVHQSGSRDDGRQNWLTLYEQALIQEGILTEDGTYGRRGGAVDVFEAVTGAEGTRHVGDPGEFSGHEPAITFDDAIAAHQEGRAVVLGTDNTSAVSSDGSIHLVEKHAYAIESVNPDGTITIVNPWGEDGNYRGEDGEYRVTVTREQFEGLFDSGYTSAPPEEWDRTGGR